MIHVDDMEIDLLVTGTQKGLEAPPGLGIIALSEGAGKRSSLAAAGPSRGTWI